MAKLLGEGSRCPVVVSAVGLDSSSGTSRPGESKGKGTEAVPFAGETKSALAMPSRTGGSHDKATRAGTDPLCELRRSMQKKCDVVRVALLQHTRERSATCRGRLLRVSSRSFVRGATIDKRSCDDHAMISVPAKGGKRQRGRKICPEMREAQCI